MQLPRFIFFFASILVLLGNNVKVTDLDASPIVFKVLSSCPESIKAVSEERIYLKESSIYSFGGQFFLESANGQHFLLPEVFSDRFGHYVALSRGVNSKKPFKLVCNRCGHEWEGGAFTVRCPVCKEKDFRIERNR